MIDLIETIIDHIEYYLEKSIKYWAIIFGIVVLIQIIIKEMSNG